MNSMTRVYNLKDPAFEDERWVSDERFVYIGRPGQGLAGEWGNPFNRKDHLTNIRNYRSWLEAQLLEDQSWRRRFIGLWGYGLMCFCAPKSCHGDVMVEKLDKLVRRKRVLVTGGREYDDGARMAAVLTALQPRIIIHGAARGADSLAQDWAVATNTSVASFPADWRGLGIKAGGMRNLQMLVEGKPDLVVAFPGGGGTEDMRRQARQNGVPVVTVTREWLP